jgi:hypothetical protein
MRQMDQGEGGRAWGGQGRQGRAGRTELGWARLGWTGSHCRSKPTTIKRTPIANRNGMRRTRDIDKEMRVGMMQHS